MAVWHHNFSIPEAIDVETDFPLLTEDQFNHGTLDTAKMYRFDSITGLQLQKAIYRACYEIAVVDEDDMGKELYEKLEDIEDSSPFYLYGKIDLQYGVNGLLCISMDMISEKTLWLFNIKDNSLCSIVLLDFFNDRATSPCPYICVNNRIFTRTHIIEEYFLSEYFGDQFYTTKKVSARYKIDENGYLMFVED